MRANNSLEIVDFESELEVSQAIADEVVELVTVNPFAKISFPTGSTLQKTYGILRDSARLGRFSLAKAQVFLLDEYVGLPRGSIDSYLSFISREIQEPCGLPLEALHFPDVHASDLHEASEKYEDLIRVVGGMDLQILGIGSNGHIGFNEPGTPLNSRTRVAHLAPETREANARYFNGDINMVPKRCITQGLSTILSAKKILLVATGLSKAGSVSALRTSRMTESLPATALLTHGDTRIFVDRQAYGNREFFLDGSQGGLRS